MPRRLAAIVAIVLALTTSGSGMVALASYSVFTTLLIASASSDSPSWLFSSVRSLPIALSSRMGSSCSGLRRENTRILSEVVSLYRVFCSRSSSVGRLDLQRYALLPRHVFEWRVDLERICVLDGITGVDVQDSVDLRRSAVVGRRDPQDDAQECVRRSDGSDDLGDVSPTPEARQSVVQRSRSRQPDQSHRLERVICLATEWFHAAP